MRSPHWQVAGMAGAASSAPTFWRKNWPMMCERCRGFACEARRVEAPDLRAATSTAPTFCCKNWPMMCERCRGSAREPAEWKRRTCGRRKHRPYILLQELAHDVRAV